jgi:LacI family transcriptional regulator
MTLRSRSFSSLRGPTQSLLPRGCTSRKKKAFSLARAVTIEEVAKAAAVSRQTVSRVINHSPRVTAQTKARVEHAIAELGYVPGLAARTNGGRRARLLLAMFESSTSGATLPLEDLIPARTGASSDGGYRLFLEPVPPDLASEAATAQFAATLRAVKPDGVVLLPPLDTRADLRAALDARGVAHTTLWGDEHVPANPGEAAAQHLLSLRHRQVGFISGPGERLRTEEWLTGYRKVLAQKGSRAHHYFVTTDQPDLPDVLELARAWLMPTIRPTAIITARANAALAVLHVARTLKISVPHDLSLVSLEDDPALARSKPPIAVLHIPVAKLFASACSRLIGLQEAQVEPVGPKEDTLTFTLELIERASLARSPRAI